MRNAIAIFPIVSAIYPMVTGAIAPPTIVMISREEVIFVFVRELGRLASCCDLMILEHPSLIV